MKKHLYLLGVLLFCTALLPAQNKREFRGAWISSVSNIDWPSRAAVGNTALQQQEMIAMLDTLQALHMNAVIFQVRPTADALYESSLEPISSWLTGEQGKDNDVHYDPLAFTLQEAHKRGIDVHVWLNPYRVTNGFKLEDLASTHIYHQHPELFCCYGDKWYFDPGFDGTREWLNKVVADIVTRYDVDAIHFDDYFYPYRVKGQEFPDDATFAAHPRGFTDKEAWRRNNVNLVIEELQTTIKSIKPWVEFGISPFGVWRNASSDPERGSATQAGVQNYDDLYADILLWLEKGWIDYVAPQLYWEIGKKVADYELLAHWWAQYAYGKNLYIGQYASMLGNKKKAEAWAVPNEICRQLRLNASIPEIDGAIFFSIKGVMENKMNLCDSLKTDYFRYPALQPQNRNLKSEAALAPRNLRIEDGALTWDAADATGGQATAYYVVYIFPQGETIDFDNPKYIVTRTADTSYKFDQYPRNSVVCVTAVNRYKQESLPAIL